MGRKIENRNIDTAKARGELEEDLLEYVYRKWRQGRQITSKEYARTTGITGYEAAGLVRSLVTKGFLYEPENNNLELTEKGKLEGMDCLARRSTKMIDTSLSRIPSRQAEYFISIWNP